MFGTFNGSEDRLAEMMDDKAAGRCFFPAHPFEQFRPDVVIDRFGKPIRGVALYDLDGDGRPLTQVNTRLARGYNSQKPS
jgi:hypothetical protein